MYILDCLILKGTGDTSSEFLSYNLCLSLLDYRFKLISSRDTATKYISIPVE